MDCALLNSGSCGLGCGGYHATYTLTLQLSMPVPPTRVPTGALAMKCRLALNVTVRQAGVDPPVHLVSVWGLHLESGQHPRGWDGVVESTVLWTLAKRQQVPALLHGTKLPYCGLSPHRLCSYSLAMPQYPIPAVQHLH